MNEMMMSMLGWAGIYGAMVLAAIGSMIGCTRAGQAACGAMLDLEGGYGRLIAIAGMPASQSIYGIVLTLALNRPLTEANAAALAAIGLFGGAAQMFSAIYQGECCAAAVVVAKTKPQAFGLAVAPAAFVEGFAVFALAFALLLMGTIPA